MKFCQNNQCICYVDITDDSINQLEFTIGTFKRHSYAMASGETFYFCDACKKAMDIILAIKDEEQVAVVKIKLNSRQEALKDKLRKFKGLSPYNNWSNICAGDGYFWKSIKGEYTEKEIEKAENELHEGSKMSKELTLENWAVVIRPDPYKAPELYTPRLHGRVYGHPMFKDGESVTTSPVVGLEGDKVVTRSGSKYMLGGVDPSYERIHPFARKRLMDKLKAQNEA